MQTLKLQCINLSKTYFQTEALKSTSFELGSGIYGLLGSNGAGKTTLLQILATLIRGDTGTIYCDGKDIAHNLKMYRKKTGYLPQECSLPDFFTIEEFMTYIAQCKELPFHIARDEIDNLLETMNLTSHRRNKVKTLSGGMKQRLAIAQAFLANPDIILLDEPTRGLDIEERENILNFISTCQQKTVIISSHVVNDIEMVCSSLLIMNRGKLVYTGLIKDLLGTYKNTTSDNKTSLKDIYLQLTKTPQENDC